MNCFAVIKTSKINVSSNPPVLTVMGTLHPAFKSRLDRDSCLCNTDTGWTSIVELHVSIMILDIYAYAASVQTSRTTNMMNRVHHRAPLHHDARS